MVEAFGVSDPGCVRTNNEDYFLLSPELGLYLVADGMGGAQAGERASKLAAETVFEVVWKSGETTAQILQEAFEEANRRVMAAASSDSTLEGMGTTLTAVLEVGGEEVLIASVGDSRAYIYENGQLLTITEDQTWVNEVGRRLGIDEASLKTHPMRHVLTMAIGVGSPLRMHCYSYKPMNGAEFLLCSDGLHGVVDPEKIAEVLSWQQSLESKCHYLVEAAKANGGPDNVTAVLLKAGATA
ncbi:MAG: protein phosphatase 2C domain-containing protein [Bryobacteraceae bacterium]|nr:protein phosphatase 2C domain-containing protein [Bryobacteraceae bacterium]